MEPTVLPAKIPNILINGASGIAAGYSTNIPPHNIVEVINALIFIYKNDNVVFSDITKLIKGPDFPTGGILSTKQEIKNSYKLGKGKVKNDLKNFF